MTTRVIRELCDQDLAGLARLHIDTFAGAMGTLLGERYTRSVIGWYRGAQGAIGLVCVEGDVIAGYVFGAPQGHGSQVTRQLLPEIVRAVATHPRAWRHPNVLLQLRSRLRALVVPSSRPIDGYGPETFNLVAIGTAPSHRNSGVAAALLDRFEQEAFRGPYQRINLHVYASNAAARTLYAKRGYEVGLDGGHVLTLEKRRPELRARASPCASRS